MKVGDLVKYRPPNDMGISEDISSLVGLIVRQIPGWAEYQVILWNNGTRSSLEKKYLRVIDESR